MGQKLTVAEQDQAVARISTAPFLPPPPAWALNLVSGGIASVTRYRQIHRAGNFLLLSLTAPARGLDGDAFEDVVAQTYQTLRTELQSESALHPLRIWNFVPRILEPVDDSQDRYMRFNAGRYQEFLKWFGGESNFDAKVPAASAVGHDGSDFVLHALCGISPATPVVNPRQRAAHRYSKKYGPIPPCFARAVTVGDSSNRQLIIGGTASVVDETSRHLGNLNLQLSETRENLAALVHAAFGTGADPSRSIDHLRVYHVADDDRTIIERFVRSTYPNLKSLEFLVGDLCRGDLLVEIEGHATRE